MLTRLLSTCGRFAFRSPTAFGACLAGLVALFAQPAAAQTPDPQKAVAAQALFDDASEEMEQKNYKAACPKLEEAVKLVPEALGARMVLAECYEGLGKLASAWTQFTMVQGLASKAGQTDRADKAEARATTLKPRLATLTLAVASELEGVNGLAITRDGVDVGKGQLGVAVPVDVGTHEIIASAPGRKTWKKSIEVIADGAKTTTKIPMLEVDKSGGGGGGDKGGGGGGWQVPTAVGAMAVGGAGIALGAVLGGLAIAKNDESNKSACNAQNQCTDTGIAMRNEALGLGNGSTAAFIAGGVLAAGGLTLFLLAPSMSKSGAGAAGGIRWAVAATPGGARIEGAW